MTTGSWVAEKVAYACFAPAAVAVPQLQVAPASWTVSRRTAGRVKPGRPHTLPAVAGRCGAGGSIRSGAASGAGGVQPAWLPTRFAVPVRSLTSFAGSAVSGA
ncbi:hypothetical protein ACGFYF_34315 [Streptomyces lavendulae]|uniref:hypothetical protein n=1 Tax=Streptomyces lavendulae TaxID=1914 RepID=UPI0037220C02